MILWTLTDEFTFCLKKESQRKKNSRNNLFSPNREIPHLFWEGAIKKENISIRTWKFILRSSTGSEGAMTLALAISNPDMRGVVTWPPSIGCFRGCCLRLKTMTRTTRRARPMPATTGPTTQTRLVRGVWLGIRSQSMPLQSPGVAGCRVALGA